MTTPAPATLVDRIEASLRANPAVEVADCWDLFKLPGFDCKDLEPTYAQATLGLAEARRRLLSGLTRAHGTLTFAEFGRANRDRFEAPSGFGRTLGDSTIDSWSLAICGEAGEIADTLYAIGHNPKKNCTLADVLDEVADVVSYCDLMAQRLGSTLEACLVAKWNRVSEKRGYPGRLR